MTNKETRLSIELRAIGDGTDKPLMLEGYAAVFNTKSQDLGGFFEVIAPGAFTRTISEKQDVKCLFNHDPNFVLGRTTSGTLALRQDDHGLFYSCNLPNTELGKSIHESVRRGDVNQCSFAFSTVSGGVIWTEERDADGNYMAIRTITDLDSYDVSPVTYPAYLDTEVQARKSLVPVELRTAIDEKNKKPEPVVEERDYTCTPDKLSAVMADDAKQAYCDAYNAKFKECVGSGVEPKAACAVANMAGLKAIAGMVASEEPGASEQPTNDIVNENSKTPVAETRAAVNFDSMDEDEDYDGDCDDDTEECAFSTSHNDMCCMDSDCPCQNRWAMKASATRAEGDKKVRTKRVGSKNLTRGKFAYVGDAKDTRTWKLPVNDADNTTKSRDAFSSMVGLGAQRDDAYGKITEAAKKFGVEMPATRSLDADETVALFERYKGIVRYL